MRKTIIIISVLFLFSIIAFLLGFILTSRYYFSKDSILVTKVNCRTRDGQYVTLKISTTYNNKNRRPEYHLNNAINEASTNIVKLYNYNTLKNKPEEAKDTILEYVENKIQFIGFEINTFELELEE